MNAEWKQKWVAALRSGTYKQGQRGLRNQRRLPDSAAQPVYEYCCLGVLCDLIDSTKWRGTIFAAGDEHEERLSYVPEKISEEIGLSCEIQHELARLNDSGYSFEHIAGVIEETL